MSAILVRKVVVITGASCGIGECTAKRLAAAGACVVVAARREPELAVVAASCGAPENALAVSCDLTKRAEHDKLLAAALEKFGKVDCWINNVGVGITKSALDLTEEDIDSMMLLNLKTAMFGMQTAVRHFKSVGHGHVINVSSLLARVPYVSFRAAYSASKAAVNSLTCSMRCDLRTEGFDRIFVALLTPGVVQTDFGARSIGGGPSNHALPGAQPVAEVAELLTAMVADPSASVDVYSRPQYRQIVSDYFSAADVRGPEGRPPFSNPAFAAPAGTAAAAAAAAELGS